MYRGVNGNVSHRKPNTKHPVTLRITPSTRAYVYDTSISLRELISATLCTPFQVT
jgi:hypothetical protein